MTLFAAQQVLDGEGVRLVPLGPDVDVDAYLAMLDDPEGRRMTGTHRAFTREQVVAWLASRPEQGDRADWAVLDPQTGDFRLRDALLQDGARIDALVMAALATD